MKPGKFQMVKAALRDDGRRSEGVDANGLRRPVPQADPASPSLGLRAVPERTTAAELLAEIQRLYLEHRATADRATQRRLETAIRACSDRFRAFRGWTIVSTAPPAKTGRPPAANGPRYFRTAQSPLG